MENPRKRTRGPPAPTAHAAAKVHSSQVLSPRSANSHTIPRSPVRPVSPGKSFLARPISPLKPIAPVPAERPASILTNMVEKAKSGRGATTTRKAAEQGATAGGAGRGKRVAAPAALPKGGGRGRATSDSSDESTGTQNTIVRKPIVPPAAKKAPPRRTVMSTLKDMGAATKKVPVAKASAPAAGTRVLRKRN